MNKIIKINFKNIKQKIAMRKMLIIEFMDMYNDIYSTNANSSLTNKLSIKHNLLKGYIYCIDKTEKYNMQLIENVRRMLGMSIDNIINGTIELDYSPISDSDDIVEIDKIKVRKIIKEKFNTNRYLQKGFIEHQLPGYKDIMRSRTRRKISVNYIKNLAILLECNPLDITVPNTERMAEGVNNYKLLNTGKIRHMMTRKRISLVKLAEQMDMSPYNMKNYLSKRCIIKTQLRYNRIKQIADIIGIDTNSILLDLNPDNLELVDMYLRTLTRKCDKLG